MRLDSRAFGIAASVTAAALFTLCSLAVAVAPDPTTAFFGYLVHMDLSTLPRTLTFGNFVGGLVAWTLGAAGAFGFAATVYNRMIGATHVAPAAPRPTGQQA